MDIKVSKMTKDEMTKKGVNKWPIWEKEVSVFDWQYNCPEECYILEGDVEVTTKDGATVKFGTGDFVSFPRGLSCTWNINKPVRKHYHFG